MVVMLIDRRRISTPFLTWQIEKNEGYTIDVLISLDFSSLLLVYYQGSCGG